MDNDQCKPLRKLKELWDWEGNRTSKWVVIPLQPSSKECHLGATNFCHSLRMSWLENQHLARDSVPKTLLCHDMAGGYLGDRFINGTQNADEYRFFHWSGVDIFVYFSHHFITLPPPGWINAAHLHGVKILGTIITEWNDGAEIWKELLKSDDNIALFVSKLTQLCVYFGFDGWLLNIENKVDETVGNIRKLVTLVDRLTKSVHEALPNSLVIWYDSLTLPGGQLIWQNELNSKNKEFFDCCDGIFLNYNWDEEGLSRSKTNAGDRYHDVFVGVDVFGRGCYGGGGFNTYKALEVARKHDLSAAIFAQGWVYEKFGARNFLPLEYCFWNRVLPYLYLHGPSELPFKTSFCQGNGLKKYHFGKEVSSTPWYNLSLQQHQPSSGSCLHLADLPSENQVVKYKKDNHGCREMYMDDAFCGGSCLIIYNQKQCNEELMGLKTFIQRLLVCCFTCKLPLLVSVVTKAVGKCESSLNIILKTKTSEEANSLILLQGSLAQTSLHDVHVIPALDKRAVKKLKSQYVLTDDVHWFDMSASTAEWEVRHYVLSHAEVTIEGIGAECCGSGSILLGFLNLQELLPGELVNEGVS